MKNFGILALQGGVEAHQRSLEMVGVQTTLVYKPEHLNGVDGLVIPGGETTALLKLMAPFHFLEAIKRFGEQGKIIFGTCAGSILLAKKVVPNQVSLGLIDAEIERNAYGRQLDSFNATVAVDAKIFDYTAEKNEPQNISSLKTKTAVQSSLSLELVYIRAPKIKAYSAAVTPLIKHGEDIVMAQQDNIIIATFHPELTTQTTLHRYVVSQE